MPHPAYLSELAPNDFFFFANLQKSTFSMDAFSGPMQSQ